MKQYTTPEQTAKLIELGFEKPKSIRYPLNEEEVDRVNSTDFLISDYTIGELIEMLPKYAEIKSQQCFFGIYPTKNKWYVFYENIVFKSIIKTSEIELIDALYEMILKLKEEGVI